jgi:hypothetical protein
VLVLKREDDVKADYFLFLLSLLGDSKFKLNFASLSEGRVFSKAVKADSCAGFEERR